MQGVSRGHSSDRSRRREGPNTSEPTGSGRAMHESGADQQAEMPGPPSKTGGGTADNTGLARPTCAGLTGQAGDETSTLMDKVVSRGNLLLAYRRVMQNKGAPGADGMGVEELMEFCRQHWPAIRERLLNERMFRCRCGR